MACLTLRVIPIAENHRDVLTGGYGVNICVALVAANSALAKLGIYAVTRGVWNSPLAWNDR